MQPSCKYKQKPFIATKLHYNCVMGMIRKTKSVETLLNAFHQGHKAISAKQLINQLDSKFKKTTIYRVLDKLE